MDRCILLSVIVSALLFINFSNAQPGSFLSNALGNNMVLQRAPQQAVIWGWTNKASSVITIKFNSGTYTTTSTNNAWSFALPATEAGGPYSIFLQSDDGESASLSNILFGDVWVCGGQSNMQFNVPMAFNATEEVADAINYPNIRIMTVGQTNTSWTPFQQFARIEEVWSVASPTSVGGLPWYYMSAVCWFFGRDLYNQYQVPIGLVSSNWGGTRIQAWSSPEALQKCNSTKVEDISIEHKLNEPKYFTDSEMLSQPGPNNASVLWNAMIVPLLQMRIFGIIWYQAEANVGQADYYSCAFPVMIEDWRTNFGYTSSLPFFFVQLAPYVAGWFPVLPDMRLAQTSALSLPTTGMAVTVDLGDFTSPEGDIHPRNKQTVGLRLSLVARAVAYGEANVQYTGPTFESYTSSQSGSTAIATISFVDTSIGGGLVYKPNVCAAGVAESSCGYASVGASDGNWYNATISIVGVNAIFKANIGSDNTVTGVRYLYNDWPVAEIFNEDGLPAAPFLSS